MHLSASIRDCLDENKFFPQVLTHSKGKKKEEEGRAGNREAGYSVLKKGTP